MSDLFSVNRKRPTSTYSIVVRDPETLALGVAVQSHWFSAGSLVSFAKAGVGAIATQSSIDSSYGPLGLALMQAGKSAEQSLQALLTADGKEKETRQVAMVDGTGNVAGFTGQRCIPHAGHMSGDGFVVQANTMISSSVWRAMKTTFENRRGDLTERMLLALEAAKEEGGDLRERQSAAILVVEGDKRTPSWVQNRFDLRVEDHDDPLKELRRLVNRSRAYEHMNQGDLMAINGEINAAFEQYEKAGSLCPEEMECAFWYAIMLTTRDKLDRAKPIFEKVFEKEPHWRELVPRLTTAGILDNNPDLIQWILSLKEGRP